MALPKLKKISADQLGDTIIEVILAIAALGTAVAVAYVSTGHSLQVGIDAGNRSRVVGLTQRQIERLKVALEDSNDDVTPYAAVGGPFCLTPGGTPITYPIRSSGPNQNYCEVCVNLSGTAQAGVLEFADKSTGICPQDGDRPLYAMQVTYKELIFTVNSRWVGPGGSVSEQTQYYKVPGINGAPLGNPGGSNGPGPVSCTYNTNPSSPNRNAFVQVDASINRYIANIALNPNCTPVPISQRSTFPGYPIIRYSSYSCYYIDGTNAYAPPNSPGPTSLNYNQVQYNGGAINRYTFYVKNPYDQCTVVFYWKGWDVRWQDPREMEVTCYLQSSPPFAPASCSVSRGLY